MTGESAIADEATQAAWAIAWKKTGTVRKASSLRPWLISVAVNEAKQRIAQAQFGKVEVLGPLQVWVHPSEKAEAHGWASAMHGEFEAEVRRNGRGERVRASMSDVQVVRFVEPPDRSAIAEWTA